MQNERQSSEQAIAAHAASTGFEQLDGETIEVTKKSILDTLGVMIAASGMSAECRTLIDLVFDFGGKAESTIIGTGRAAPAWAAAFANGALAHSLDYDDLYYDAPVHASSPVIAAALAVAERRGGVSGREFLAAVAVGNDITCRMGDGMHWKMDWNPTTVLGAFGATAAAGKVLGLNRDQTINALGIAYSEAAGTQEMRYSVGNHMGGLRDGYPARGGVLSALMAQRGIRGPENFLEGKAGLYKVYFGGDFDKQAMLADLGQKFIGTKISFKAWPTCGTSHVYIDATLRLMATHDIRPEDISRITLFVGDFGLLHCEPLEQRRRPVTPADAKYSIPYAVALAAAKKRLLLDDLTADALSDATVLHMAQRVDVELDPAFNAEKGEPPGKVEITLTNGDRRTLQLDHGYGHYKNPISFDDVVSKFRDCAAHASRPMSASVQDKTIDLIMNLDKIDDISAVAMMMRG